MIWVGDKCPTCGAKIVSVQLLPMTQEVITREDGRRFLRIDIRGIEAVCANGHRHPTTERPDPPKVVIV